MNLINGRPFDLCVKWCINMWDKRRGKAARESRERSNGRERNTNTHGSIRGEGLSLCKNVDMSISLTVESRLCAHLLITCSDP